MRAVFLMESKVQELEIRQVTTKNDMTISGVLVREYLTQLGNDLIYQKIEDELKDLSQCYPIEQGGILLAFYKQKPVGIVALKDLGNHICEMKRLFVRDEFRGLGIGKTLTLTLIEKAREVGYVRMRLDTVRRLKTAVQMYCNLGFEECGVYTYNPFEDALFFEKLL